MASTASSSSAQTMTSSLPPTKKRHPNLWIHQTVALDASATSPNIFVQPSSPSVNLYKRSAVNRFRKKSGEENPAPGIKATKAVSGRLSDFAMQSTEDDRTSRIITCETLPEEDHNGEEEGRFASDAESTAAVAPLASPTKRVTFLERITGTAPVHKRSFDKPDDESRREQFQVPLSRRVRKSKTLDVVEGSSSDRSNTPRSQVMEFFSQIRTAPSAPWKSSSSSSGMQDSASPSSGSGRPRSFTLGFKPFANFRQPQQQQREGRKISRQSLRNVDAKEKRKRPQSQSFRTPAWLNVSRSKTDQSNLLTAEPPVLKPIIRKRSISANDLNLLIMRQTSSEPEVCLSLNGNDNAYQKILSNFSCYELMPQQGVVVGFDCRFTGRQALQTLAKNEVRVALLWDFASGGMVGVLTATDLLLLFADHKVGLVSADARDTNQESACPCGEDVLGKPLTTTLYECSRSKKTKRQITSVGSESSVRAALSLLLGNRYHRIAVVSSKTGDVLYFLSKKAVLHFLMHHMSSLPTPAVLRRTLDELRLGTWKSEKSDDGGKEDEKRILSTVLSETLVEAVPKFLTADVSALPVLDKNQRLVDSLAKYDVIYYLTSNAGKLLEYQTVTVEEVLQNRRQGFKRTITCPSETTLFIALERLIKTHSRRLYIVDSDGAFRAVVTISDVLSFLMA